MSRQQLPPVKWTFVFDTKCVHVNLVDRTCPTILDDEEEYLFPPLSVFTVTHVDFKDKPSVDHPHEISVSVAPDNRMESDDLPIAPWC